MLELHRRAAGCSGERVVQLLHTEVATVAPDPEFAVKLHLLARDRAVEGAGGGAAELHVGSEPCQPEHRESGTAAATSGGRLGRRRRRPRRHRSISRGREPARDADAQRGPGSPHDRDTPRTGGRGTSSGPGRWSAVPATPMCPAPPANTSCSTTSPPARGPPLCEWAEGPSAWSVLTHPTAVEAPAVHSLGLAFTDHLSDRVEPPTPTSGSTPP